MIEVERTYDCEFVIRRDGEKCVRYWTTHQGKGIWAWFAHAERFSRREEAESKLMELVLSGELEQANERTVL